MLQGIPLRVSSWLPTSTIQIFRVGRTHRRGLHFWFQAGLLNVADKSKPVPPGHRYALVHQRFKHNNRHLFYRLRKGLGKGSWWRYRERYVSPMRMETRKTLWYNYKPTRSELQVSQRWRWEIFQALARATTSNKVLDIWIHYRHKRKSQKHFMACLYRLVQLGNLDITDWRYRTFVRRLNVFRRRWINLPRLVLYLARLNDQKNVERWCRKCHELYHLYSPRSQGMILDALGRVQLQDSFLFGRISQDIAGAIMSPEVDVHLLLKLLESHARVLLRNARLSSVISAELQRRVQLGSSLQTRSAVASRSVRKTELGESNETDQQSKPLKVEPNYLPSIKHLVQAAYWFAELHFVDFTFFELCAFEAHSLFRNQHPFPPSLITRLFGSFVKADVRDYSLFYAFLNHFSKYLHDYAPDDATRMAYLFTRVLPLALPEVQHPLAACGSTLMSYLDLLSITAIKDFLEVYAALRPAGIGLGSCETLLAAVEPRLIRLLETQKDTPLQNRCLDTPRLLDLLLDLGSQNATAFRLLGDYILRQVNYMEPKDAIALLRFARKRRVFIEDGWLNDHPLLTTLFSQMQYRLVKEMSQSEKQQFAMTLRGYKHIPEDLLRYAHLPKPKTQCEDKQSGVKVVV